MGLYDEVTNGGVCVQIKSTPCEMKEYKLGSEIDLPDGVHVGYEGAFVVSRGHVSFVTDKLWDKYGGQLTGSEIISPHNPISHVVAAMIKDTEEDNP